MKRLFAIFLTVCMLLSLTSTSVMAEEKSDTQKEGWIMETNLPRNHRSSYAVSAYDNKIYIISGMEVISNSGVATNSVDIYDTIKKSWSQGTPTLYKKHSFGAVTVGTKIYTIGGSVNNGTITNTMESYDVLTGTWKSEMSMSEQRYNHSVVAVNNKIYVFGGNSKSEALKSIEIYDTETQQWTKGTDMPIAKSNFGAAYLDGKIFIIGGYEKGGSNLGTTTVDIYDINSDTWSTGESMPIENSQCSLAVVANKIYVIGGNTSGDRGKSVYTYDTELKFWEKVDSMNQNRNGSPVVIVNDKIYAIGEDIKYSIESFQIKHSLDTKLSVLLYEGETVQLSITKRLSDNEKLIWSSSNQSITTVDQLGKVTAMAEGDTEIYAKNSEGSFEDKIRVKVVKDNKRMQ